MKKQPIIITTVLLAGLLGFSQTVSATGFKDRQHQQKHRIQSGIASGQITHREAKHLYRDQRQIRQLRRHFLADGDLSRRERNTLKERLDRSSNRIYRYKHNHRRVKPPRNFDGSQRHFARR
jgi:hypothetical protein